MKQLAIQLRSASIISLLLVLPLLSLQLINRRHFDEGFPFFLYAVLWILPVAFILTLMPIVRTLRGKDLSWVKVVAVLVGVTFLLLVAWEWAVTVVDQMPCFLGVPHCD